MPASNLDPARRRAARAAPSLSASAVILGLAVVALGGAPLRAQVPLASHFGTDLSEFGASLAGIGDVNADGIPDYVAGAPFAEGNAVFSGAVYVVSGLDGAVLYDLHGDATSDLFGWSVANVGDLDGDGRNDFVVGAPNVDAFRGQVTVCSGADGSVIVVLDGVAAGDRFGWALAGLGDVTGDGVPDFAVGAWGTDAVADGAGSVYVYGGASLAVFRTFHGEVQSDHFGAVLAGPGDLNGDGRGDLIVGLGEKALDKDAMGIVYAYDVSGNVLLFHVDGVAQDDQLGTAVAGPGDVNGDGVPDLLVGVPGEDPPLLANGGSAFVYSGKDGSELAQLLPQVTQDSLGEVVAATGDMNGDGLPDYAASSLDNSEGGSKAGMVRVQSAVGQQILLQLVGSAANEAFGSAVAAVGDLDGDGLADIAVGAPLADDDTIVAAGRVDLYQGIPWENLGGFVKGKNGEPQLQPWGTLAPGTQITLSLTNAYPTSPCVTVLGFGELGAPFKGGTLVPLPNYVTPAVPIDGVGNLELSGTWPDGIPAGFHLYLQLWFEDTFVVQGFGGTDGWVAIQP